MANLVTEFTQADLNGSNQFILTHNLNKDVTPTYYDENGVQQHTFGVFQVDSANQCTLSLNNTITGTHKLILSYDAETPAVSGIKLFDRPTGSYDNTYKIALGKSGTPTINVPIENFSDQLANDLDAANKDLSNLNNPTAALVYNLGGRTASQISQDLAFKTDRYNQSNGGAALSVDNTKLYTPTSKYHPATLQTVNNDRGGVVWAGIITTVPGGGIFITPFFEKITIGFSDVTYLDVGRFRVYHNLGDSLKYSTHVQRIVTEADSDLTPISYGIRQTNDYVYITCFDMGFTTNIKVDGVNYVEIKQQEPKL